MPKKSVAGSLSGSQIKRVASGQTKGMASKPKAKAGKAMSRYGGASNIGKIASGKTKGMAGKPKAKSLKSKYGSASQIGKIAAGKVKGLAKKR